MSLSVTKLPSVTTAHVDAGAVRRLEQLRIGRRLRAGRPVDPAMQAACGRPGTQVSWLPQPRRAEQSNATYAQHGKRKSRLLGKTAAISVEAPGIEAGLRQIESTMEHGLGTIGTDGDPASVSDRASKCAIVRRVVTESSEAYELSNVVETALARALLLAAEAGRWDVVGRIAAELEGRRTGRVVPMGLTKASR